MADGPRDRGRHGRGLLDTIAALTVSAGIATAALAAPGTAVEFFHAELGHYFVTSFQDEIAILDAGAVTKGWVRTGYAFSVGADATAGDLPVCRFFSTSFAPKSSHFYTPYDTECASLKAGATWSYEGIAFHLKLPSDAGACAAGATSVYRLYNNGVTGAPNHRYTAVRAVFDAMQAQGWTAEGHATTGVFACGPPAPQGSSANVTVTSTKQGVGYNVAITVPTGYHVNSDPLPVVYGLDGQRRGLGMRDVILEPGNRVILVAIDDMGRRQQDFNMPGGADYLDFLTQDLIPYIEARYRADPTRRVLNGHSTGGNLVFHALFLESPSRWSFAHYWSADGAFWQQQAIVFDEESRIFDRVGRSPMPVVLILSRGGANSNGASVGALHDLIASRNYAGLRLIDLQYRQLDHGAMDEPSFRDSLDILLGR